MKIILIILCVIGLIATFSYRRKIDEEEKVALKTPGQAGKLRASYGNLISMLLNNSNNRILFEREYDESIRFGNNRGQELFVSYTLGTHGPQIHVACIEHSQVMQEWTFDHRKTDSQIYQEITNYFG